MANNAVRPDDLVAAVENLCIIRAKAKETKTRPVIKAVIKMGFRPSTEVFLNDSTFRIFAVQKNIRYFQKMVASITPDQPRLMLR